MAKFVICAFSTNKQNLVENFIQWNWIRNIQLYYGILIEEISWETSLIFHEISFIQFNLLIEEISWITSLVFHETSSIQFNILID